MCAIYVPVARARVQAAIVSGAELAGGPNKRASARASERAELSLAWLSLAPLQVAPSSRARARKRRPSATCLSCNFGRGIEALFRSNLHLVFNFVVIVVVVFALAWLKLRDGTRMARA